jgi:nuclear pore complex protein Nup50
MSKPSDTSNGSASKNVKTDSTDVTSDSKSTEYYSNLKGLNQCVSRWIKSHVDSNPLCILTPIFKDYERYLTEIDEKESKQQLGKEADVTQRREKSPEKSPTTEVIMTEWYVYFYATIDVYIMSIWSPPLRVGKLNFV